MTRACNHPCDKCNPPPKTAQRGQVIEDLPEGHAFVPQDFWPVLKRKQPTDEIA